MSHANGNVDGVESSDVSKIYNALFGKRKKRKLSRMPRAKSSDKSYEPIVVPKSIGNNKLY